MSRIRSVHPNEWASLAKSATSEHHFYVVQEGDDGPVKVGIARNAVWRRTDLQVGNPREIFLRAVFACADRVTSALMEKFVLGEFLQNAIRGEWLDVELNAVLGAINEKVSQWHE